MFSSFGGTVTIEAGYNERDIYIVMNMGVQMTLYFAKLNFVHGHHFH